MISMRKRRGVEGVGVGNGEAADGAGVDLAGVAHTCGIQGLVELVDGLRLHVSHGVAEVESGSELGDEAVWAVGLRGEEPEVGAHRTSIIG